jgi:hypothetical protein
MRHHEPTIVSVYIYIHIHTLYIYTYIHTYKYEYHIHIPNGSLILLSPRHHLDDSSSLISSRAQAAGQKRGQTKVSSALTQSSQLA